MIVEYPAGAPLTILFIIVKIINIKPHRATNTPEYIPSFNGKSEKLHSALMEKCSSFRMLYLLSPASLFCASNSNVVLRNPTLCTYPLK